MFSCFQVNWFLSRTDIAVGAPYDDGGTGKVYIYHGSAQGIKTSPAQVGFCEVHIKAALIHIFRQHNSLVLSTNVFLFKL